MMTERREDLTPLLQRGIRLTHPEGRGAAKDGIVLEGALQPSQHARRVGDRSSRRHQSRTRLYNDCTRLRSENSKIVRSAAAEQTLQQWCLISPLQGVDCVDCVLLFLCACSKHTSPDATRV